MMKYALSVSALTFAALILRPAPIQADGGEAGHPLSAASEATRSGPTPLMEEVAPIAPVAAPKEVTTWSDSGPGSDAGANAPTPEPGRSPASLAPSASGTSGADPSRPPRYSDTRSTFEAVQPLVFPIKTAVAPDAAKVAYGSGFAVSEDGLVITNFHVIAKAIHAPSRYKTYLMDGNRPLEARPVAFDVINDLALLKVNRVFPGSLRPAETPPESGEKLYSVGLPEDLNMSLVEGIFNGRMGLGVQERYLLSSPINPGMSGGPTLDRSGRLVGVNVAILRQAQNLSFAVPGRFVARLIEEAGSRSPASIPPASETARDTHWIPAIRSQLERAQDLLTGDWSSKAAADRIRLGSWSAFPPPPDLKCWRDRKDTGGGDGAPAALEATVESCHSIFSSAADPDARLANYEVAYVHLKNNGLSAMQFFRNVEDAFHQGPFASMESQFSAAGSLSDVYTRPDCSERTVVNRNGVPLKVRYCLAGLAKYDSLVDALVKVATVEDSRESLMVGLRLAGFRAGNIKTLIREIVESVEKIRKDGTR